MPTTSIKRVWPPAEVEYSFRKLKSGKVNWTAKAAMQFGAKSTTFRGKGKALSEAAVEQEIVEWLAFCRETGERFYGGSHAVHENRKEAKDD